MSMAGKTIPTLGCVDVAVSMGVETNCFGLGVLTQDVRPAASNRTVRRINVIIVFDKIGNLNVQICHRCMLPARSRGSIRDEVGLLLCRNFKV